MNSTPEERDCQSPVGTNGTPEDWDRQIQSTNKPFPPLYEKIRQGSGLTTSDLNTIIEEVGGKPIETPVTKVVEVLNSDVNSHPEKKKNLEETKKLLETFKEKVATYPKYLSYEGSVVLCVMLSVNEAESISLSGMPSVDRELILAQLPKDAPRQLEICNAHLKVAFDDARDFVLTYEDDKEKPVVLRFFNTVIHPQKLRDTNVPIEKDGEKVFVGSSLVLDKKRIQKLVGTIPHEEKSSRDDEDMPRRQPVSGRNAYEIRADVLQMALDWSVKTDEFRKKTDDDVVSLAKKFYEFVEDRRRR